MTFQNRLIVQRIFCVEPPGYYDFLIIINGCHRKCGTSRLLASGAYAISAELNHAADIGQMIARLEFCVAAHNAKYRNLVLKQKNNK